LESLGVDFIHDVTVVGFEGQPVYDDDLAALDELPDIRILTFGPFISDRGLVHLQSLSQLWSLNMASSAISDAGLEHLASLQRLQYLAIQNANISDNGLAHLRELNSLVYLGLYETRVTRSGAVALSKSLPDCNIYVWRKSEEVFAAEPHPMQTD
jgi:hypothetical protein